MTNQRGSLPKPSMEACLERSKFLYQNPLPLPHGVAAILSFCKGEEK